MLLLKCTARFKSVHPHLKTIYVGRFWYVLGLIPAFCSIFHELGLPPVYYIALSMFLVIWPHFAFYIAAASKRPKQIEAFVNHVFELAFIGFMLPLTRFNPFIIMLACISLGMVGFTDKPTLWRIIVLRAIGFILALGIGAALFGFHFEYNISLLTIICAGGYLIAFNYINLITAYTTTRKITETRKEIKEALDGRNHAYEKLNRELKIAESYVRNMLPEPITAGPIQSRWLFQPTATLGGDAFGYYWIDREHFVFYLLDVSGHGVGAALLSVSVLNDLRLQTLQNVDFRQPRQVLTALNSAFPSEKHDDMFFTIWYGVYDRSTRILKYASAGHPPAILLDSHSTANAGAILLHNSNSIIGGLPSAGFIENALSIQDGSALYVYSDGVYEVTQSDGTMWSFDAFKTDLQHIDPKENSRIEQLYAHVQHLHGSKSLDDDFSILELVFA